MIVLTRLDGSRLGINADQIERLDESPATVVTLTNGNSYLVTESLDDVVDKVVEYQARTRGGAPARPRPSRPVRSARSTRARTDHLRLADDGASDQEQ